MTTRVALTPMLRLLLAGACLVVIVSGLQAAAPVVNPLLLATLIVPMVLPLQQALIRRGMSRAVSVAITVLVLIIGLVAVVGFVGTSVAEMATHLPTYAPRLSALRDSLFEQLQRRGVDTSHLNAYDALNPGRLITLASGALRTLAGALSDALFVVLLLAFALPLLGRSESEQEKARDEQRARTLEGYFADMRKYVAITSLCGAINATIALAMLLTMGVDFAITWAVLFFLMNFVPAVGFLVALVPPVLLALLEFGWTKAIIVAAVYTVTNFLVDSVLKPRIMAEGLDLSPLVVIVALVFWSWVLGPIGAIMAVPITMVLRKLAMQYAGDDSLGIGI
jgi:AI-2 transport protein TqsA